MSYISQSDKFSVLYGNSIDFHKKFSPFLEAREFSRRLGFKSNRDWRKYCNSGKRPNNIPPSPYRTYKDSGWKGWVDWQGTEYLSFKDAKKFVRTLNLKSTYCWDKYCSSGKKPFNLPSSPNTVYKNIGWKDWEDWLGCKLKFKSLKEAKKFVHKLGIKSQKYWREYCNSGKKPADIPSQPYGVYLNAGWKDWQDWLGSKYVSTLKIKSLYISLKESKAFVRKLDFKSVRDWWKYCKSGKKPSNVPGYPNRSYKNNGWKNWPDWLGNNA
jgi:hypothetical protein